MARAPAVCPNCASCRRTRRSSRATALVTSGIDGTYPAGLAVAQVVSVERETGQMFARVTCKPLAGVDASPQVLILGSAASAPPRPEEPAEADAPRKGRGTAKG